MFSFIAHFYRIENDPPCINDISTRIKSFEKDEFHSNQLYRGKVCAQSLGCTQVRGIVCVASLDVLT